MIWRAVVVVSSLFLFWKFIQRVQFTLRGKVSQRIQKIDLTGQIFCLTGGNRGIGFETAKILLDWGGFVVLGVRDVQVCEDLYNRILSSEEKQRLVITHLDLSSFDSVRSFVQNNFLKPKRRLDCLINNAHHSGLSHLVSTPDCIEYSYQVNYLSHCLLTLLLIPIMSSPGQLFSSAPSSTNTSRIIHVGSRTHVYGHIQRERYNAQNRNLFSYDPNRIYPDTKLMQLLFCKRLTFFLQELGYNISSNYVHPGGLVRTTNKWIRGSEYSLAMRLEPILMKFAGTEVIHAAMAVVKAAGDRPKVVQIKPFSQATVSAIEGNKYFDTTEEQTIQLSARLEEDALWLWQNTLEMIGISDTYLSHPLSEAS
jgi:NAD(P)-dependent dehydrogenase (short-subunit alcohol dehydrogenase family)